MLFTSSLFLLTWHLNFQLFLTFIILIFYKFYLPFPWSKKKLFFYELQRMCYPLNDYLESFVHSEICVAHSAENHDRFSWMWIIFNMPCFAFILRTWDPFLSFVLVLCAWDPLESFVIISPLRYSESQFVAANHWIKLPLQRSLYLFNVFLWFDNNVVCLSSFLMLNLLSGYWSENFLSSI